MSSSLVVVDRCSLVESERTIITEHYLDVSSETTGRDIIADCTSRVFIWYEVTNYYSVDTVVTKRIKDSENRENIRLPSDAVPWVYRSHGDETIPLRGEIPK